MNPLIQPVLKGQALLAEIASTCPEAGTLAVWWLGQSGFLIKSRSSTLVVDPYLSEHLTQKYAQTDKPHIRMTEAPCRGEDLRPVDLILASHKHSDHLDPGTMPGLMAASPEALLVVPAALVEHAAGLGLPAHRLIGLEAGQCHRHKDVRVEAVPAAHEALDTDLQGRHLYLGYVIEIGGQRLYHSGDGVLYEGLAERLAVQPFDVLFLPINGRDPARGVPGNMSAQEAVALAGQVRPRFLVPHHYDMFTFNTVPVRVFADAVQRLPAGVTSRVLRCGERWLVPAHA